MLETSVVDEISAVLDDDRLARLRAAVAEEEGDGALANTTLQHFHVVLASLAGNGATQLFLEMLIELQNAHVRSAPEAAGGGIDRRDGNVSRAAHRAIAEAIIAGDGALARHRMRRHLEGIDDYLRQRHGGQAQAATTVDEACM